VFAGIVYRGKKKVSVSTETFVNILNTHGQADRVNSFEHPHATMVQCTTWNTLSTQLDPSPYIDTATNIVICSWARLDNRAELADKLGIDQQALKKTCDSEMIVKAYLKWQQHCVDHLVGDFSFVLFDVNNHECFCARDHMGIKPFYYFLNEDYFVFSTHISIFNALPFIRTTIDEQWVLRFYLDISIDYRKTPFDNVQKLPPAHKLQIGEKHHHEARYFSFDLDIKHRYQTLEDYTQHYKSLLFEAIRTRTESNYGVGSEMSGGLDSSSIAIIAKQFLNSENKTLHTYGQYKQALDKECIDCVIEHADFRHHVTTHNAEHINYQRFKKSAQVLGMPSEFDAAGVRIPFYQLLKKNNLRTLLSGFGGDQCVTNHGAAYPVECLAHHQYLTAWKHISGSGHKKLRKFLRMILTTHAHKKLTFPGIYREKLRRFQHSAVHKTWLSKELTQDYFKCVIDCDTKNFSVNAFTANHLFNAIMSTRLEVSTLLANAYKIDYRWPLLDIRLIQFYLSIPPKLKYKAKINRYFHRQAMTGILPEFIQWREKNTGRMHEMPCFTDYPEALSLLDQPQHKLLEKLMDRGLLEKQLSELIANPKTNPDTPCRHLNFTKNYELNEWLTMLD
jgi:asparagine synthase (glutamine-hydrolysing)